MSDREELREYLQSKQKGVFGSKMRFELVSPAEGGSNDKPLKLGTYGFIRGAKTFIVGVVEKGRQSLFDYGYAMEEIILFASSKQLATCWLGLTFSSDFSKSVRCAEDELLPAISPIGYPAKSRRLTEKVMRLSVGARKRKPWSELFFSTETLGPVVMETLDDELRQSLEMVRLGPSASNKQPWRLFVEPSGEVVHFYLEPSPGYDKPSNPVQLQKLDMGIALCHLDFCLREFGRPGKIIEGPPEIGPADYEYCFTWKMI